MKIEVELSDEQIAWLRIAADQGQYAGRLRRLMESLTDALPKSVVVSVELGPALAKELRAADEFVDGWASGMELGPHSAAALNALCGALYRHDAEAQS